MTIRSTASVRSRVAAWCAASALVFTTACGGADQTTKDVGPKELVSTTAPAKGDIPSLTWNLTAGEPDTLDPTNAVTFSGGTVVSNLCDPLMRMGPDFSLEPNLATMEVESPTRIVFTIRDDAKFWNGNPVTAEDVAYSLNRAKAPTRIVSFIYANVKSIMTSGVNEVVVEFNKPDEMFTKQLGNISMAIVEKKFTEAAGDKFGTPEGGLMCSGPLKLDAWKSGDSINLSRNDSYWNTEYRARPGKVRYTFITDSTALTQALNAGEIDGAYEISPDAISTLQESSVGTLRFGPSTQTLTIGVAQPDGPTADIKVREALQTMIDRDALAKIVYQGAATPNYTFATPELWEPEGKDIYQPAYDKIKDSRRFDVAKAKSLVKESSYDGTEIVLGTLAGNAAANQIAQLIQQQGTAVGLDIAIRPLQPLEFDQAGYDPAKRKGIDLLLQSGFNGTQDPSEPVGFSLLPDAFYNYTGFNDPVVTNAINDLLHSFDPKERAALFVKAQEAYEAKSPFIPLLSTNTVSFLNNDYTGAVTSWAYWSMPSAAVVGAAE